MYGSSTGLEQKPAHPVESMTSIEDHYSIEDLCLLCWAGLCFLLSLLRGEVSPRYRSRIRFPSPNPTLTIRGNAQLTRDQRLGSTAPYSVLLSPRTQRCFRTALPSWGLYSAVDWWDRTGRGLSVPAVLWQWLNHPARPADGAFAPPPGAHWGCALCPGRVGRVWRRVERRPGPGVFRWSQRFRQRPRAAGGVHPEAEWRQRLVSSGLCSVGHNVVEISYIQYQSKVWTPTHSRVFLYFYYFPHCRIIVKTSKLWNNTHGIM